MKKGLIFLICVLVLLVLFCACQDLEPIAETTAQTTAEITTKAVGSLPDRPDYETYDVRSYDELEAMFFGEESMSNRQNILNECPEMTQMLSCLSENGSVPIPRLQGEPIPLRVIQNLPVITIFSSEMHNKPWVYFQCLYNGNYFRVQYTYTSLFNIAEGETDVAKLIEAAEPGFPNAENVENFKGYNWIENGKIKVGTELLPCVFYEFSDGYSLSRVSFLYHDFYVIIYADFNKLDEDFFKNFSIS